MRVLRRLLFGLVLLLVLLVAVLKIGQPKADTVAVPSPTPLDPLSTLVIDTLSPESLIEARSSDTLVVVRYEIRSVWDDEHLRYRTHEELVALTCALRDANYTSQEYRFAALTTFVAPNGDQSLSEAVEAIIPAEVVANLNCANQVGIDLARLATTYFVDQAIR